MDQDKRRNTSNPRGKGNPSDTGHDKAAIKKGKTGEDFEKEEEIREKYTDEGEEVPSHLKKRGNPNRNQDKPDIDKPTYGG